MQRGIKQIPWNHRQHVIHPTQIWFELIQETNVQKILKGSGINYKEF